MRRVLLLALATASVATVSIAAVTPAAKPTGQISVSYADLNLATPAGARTLVSRIRTAANELCGPELVGDVGRLAERTNCVRDTQARAIQVVDRPTVTAAYLGLPQPDAIALAGPSR